MSSLTRYFIVHFIILVIGAVIFIPFLGHVHLFDWDEINFAESAREMIVTGNYLDVQINYQVFWEKPPLFFWMQVLSMKVFGVNEFAARLPNAICGILTLMVLFNIGRKIYDDRFGWIWILTYIGSLLPFFYFKSGIIDPWFNLFIFLGIHHFALYADKKEEGNKTARVIFSALFLGLAVLTKGPVAIVIFGITFFVFLFANQFHLYLRFYHVIIFTLVLTLVGGTWFLLQIFNGNYDVIKDFIEYQVRLFQTKDAGHGGFLFYHFVIVFIGVFPASVIALQGFRRRFEDNPGQREYKKWMIILLLVVLVLFSIVRTKIVHYSSLTYFPLTFLASYVFYYVFSKKLQLKNFIPGILAFLGIIIGTLTIILTRIEHIKPKLIETFHITHPFTLGNLQANANWKGYEFIVGIFLLFGILVSLVYFKKGKKSIGMAAMYVSCAIYAFFAMYLLVPRVEEYSQNAAIEFYKEKAREDCHVETLGFKSYADLFYTKKQPPENPRSLDREWLLTGEVDKTVYFVMKVHKKATYFEQYPDLEFLYKKNGFVFCKRVPARGEVKELEQ